MRYASRTLAATVATPLIALGLGACGADEKTVMAEDVAPSATTSASASQQEQPAGELSRQPTPKPNDGRKVDAAAVLTDLEAAVRSAQSAHVVMDLGPITAEGDTGYGPTGPAMSLTMSMASAGLQRIDLRYVDGAMYMAVPGLVPPGKFVKVDSSDRRLGAMIGQLRSMGPDASLELLEGSVKSMRRMGQERVDDTLTDHYVLEVDTMESMRLLGKMESPQGAKLPRTMTYELWVGKDKLVRRIVASAGSLSVRFEYSDWGKPVRVQAPDAADVVPLPKNF